MREGDEVTIQNYCPEYDGKLGTVWSVCGSLFKVMLDNGQMIEFSKDKLCSGKEEEAGEMSMDTLW